eukprot:4818846-Pyramimonas_sp.AAC.1
MAAFLSDQRRSLVEKMTAFDAQFPPPGDTNQLLSSAEAKLLVICKHTGDILQMYHDGAPPPNPLLTS